MHRQYCRHLGKTVNEQTYFRNPCLCGTYIFVEVEDQLRKVMDLSTGRPWAPDQTHLRRFHRFEIEIIPTSCGDCERKLSKHSEAPRTIWLLEVAAACTIGLLSLLLFISSTPYYLSYKTPDRKGTVNCQINQRH